MKGLIVVDIQDNCYQCPAYSDEWDICNVSGEDTTGGKKPDWCPIRPIPEKMKITGKYPQPDGIVPSYKYGWNACIDEILKGESNED